MNIIDIINKKREKGILSKNEIEYVIKSYLNDEIRDYQVSSLLMAICLNGMNEQETKDLTEAMLNSGEIFDMSSISGIKVDKHSTGGVGDKTTLVVAPLVASCGLVVSKLSGRGLGHTGGTIDKLESIKGFNVNLSNDEFMRQLKDIGVAIMTSTLNIAPADKKLYALRDVTGTIASNPLIASSIMSKKLATNADKIVLDVKVGQGAFMKTKEEATELARIMIRLGKDFNKEVVALITNMNYPLGNSIGNGLEVMEAIETLKGNVNNNFKELCIELASYMVSVGKGINIETAKEEVITNLNNGNAYKKFEAMITYQGGDINSIDIAPLTIEYKANKQGYINKIDALKLGKYAMYMGAGRETKEDSIDYGVGIVLNCQIGSFVNIGDVLATLYVRNNDIDTELLNDVFHIENNKNLLEPLIYDIII